MSHGPLAASFDSAGAPHLQFIHVLTVRRNVRRFSRDPLAVLFEGSCCKQFLHGQRCPLFDVVHPAFPLPTTAETMPKPCRNHAQTNHPGEYLKLRTFVSYNWAQVLEARDCLKVLSIYYKFCLLGTDFNAEALSRRSTNFASSASSPVEPSMSSLKRRLVIFLPPVLTVPLWSSRRPSWFFADDVEGSSPWWLDYWRSVTICFGLV